MPPGFAGGHGSARVAGYQTGYRPQRTVVNSGGLRRTYRLVSGAHGERRRTVVNGAAFHGMQEVWGSNPHSSTQGHRKNSNIIP